MERQRPAEDSARRSQRSDDRGRSKGPDRRSHNRERRSEREGEHRDLDRDTASHPKRRRRSPAASEAAPASASGRGSQERPNEQVLSESQARFADGDKALDSQEPQGLKPYILSKCPTPVDDWLLDDAIACLKQAGISHELQLSHVNKEMLQDICRNGGDRIDPGRYSLLATVCNEFWPYWPQTPQNDQPRGLAQASVEAMAAIARSVKRQGRDRRGDRGDRSPSSSDSKGDKESVDVCKALKRYGLAGLPLQHLPREDIIQSKVRKGRKKARHSRIPWVKGTLNKEFEPLWRTTDKSIKEVQKGQEYGGFAHFASCWWSRAFVLMTLMADTNNETVSFESLLRRFLDLCQMAQEDGVSVAYKYDRHEWAMIASRVEAKDEKVDPSKMFQSINTDTRRNVKEQAAWTKTANASNSSTSFGGGKSDYGKSHGKGKSSKGAYENRRPFPPPPPRPRQF